MIDLIKPYLNLFAGVVILAILCFTHFKAYQIGEDHIQKKFDTYRSNINDEISKNEIEKARIEAEHVSKYNMAQTGYAGALDELNRRLRDIKTLPRGEGVPMAGCGSSTMSNTSESTTGTQVKLTTFKGTCSREFYEAAMSQTLQCEKLIEFIK